MRPSRMRSAVTAAPTRSCLDVGIEDAVDTSPTWCPARPTRCRPLATDGGVGDLDDEVDRAHVDAQFQARRGDDATEPAGLEVVLDQLALLLADRAVVRSGPGPVRLPCSARSPPISWAGSAGVDAAGSTACRSAHASFRRAVSRSASPRELQNTMVDRTFEQAVEQVVLDVRPDARGGRVVRPRLAASEVGHVVDRDASPSRDRRTSLSGATMRHRSTAAEEPGHLVVRTHGGAQPDPSRGPSEQLVQTLQ